jgi:hypothetical protein
VPAEPNHRWGRAALLAGLALTAGGCAAEPPPAVTTAPVKVEMPRTHAPERGLSPALTESLRSGLIRAQDALKAGAIDAEAYERILLAHQRTVATLAAIEALGWGTYPPAPAPGNAPSPRPPTRVEAIERLTEMLYRPEPEERHRRGPRR